MLPARGVVIVDADLIEGWWEPRLGLHLPVLIRSSAPRAVLFLDLRQ
jgi:hypothetical protein